MKKLVVTPENVRNLRRMLGLNQLQFWNKIGITQSGGSRYETGRNIPGVVQTLVKLAYGGEAEANSVLAQLRKRENKA